MKSVKVSDYMVGYVLSVEEDDDLFKAIGLMLKHKIASVPVLSKKGSVVGMLSQWDCLKKILAGSYSEEIGGVVKDLMNQTVHTVSPNDDIVDVAAAMTSNGWHLSLPVVERGKLIGTIGCPDILEAIYDFDTHKAA
jgi:CBS domain-containing protein